MKTLIEKARNCDRGAALQLFRDYPDAAKLYTEHLGVGETTREKLMELLLGDKDQLAREACRRQVLERIEELAGANPSGLEKQLAEQSVTCWLHCQWLEQEYASQVLQGTAFVKLDSLQKALDRANRRYLSAMKTLALARRLQLPTVQVNIGEKQVNMAMDGSTRNLEQDIPKNALR